MKVTFILTPTTFYCSVSPWNEAAGANLLHKAAGTHPPAAPATHQRPQTCTGEQAGFYFRDP